MRPVNRIFLISLLVMITGYAACSVRDDYSLGSMGNVSVGVEEFTAFARLESNQEVGDLDMETRTELLKKLLVRKALAGDAEEKGLDKDPLFEKSMLQWKLKNYPAIYWKTEVRDKVRVTEEELRDNIQPEDQFLLSAIVMHLSEGGREEALEVHGVLESGADFAEVARERSYGITADKGGHIGWRSLSARMFDEQSAQAIRELEEGAYTLPLETAIGWVIFYLKDRVSAEENFQTKREEALETVKGEKISKEERRLVKELRDKASIVYPAEKAGPESGAPLAVVEGYAVFPEEIPTHHQFSFSEIQTQKERLESFITAFLVVMEVEKLGLDKGPETAMAHQLARIKILSEMALNQSVEDQFVITDEEIMDRYQQAFLPEVYQLQVVMTRDRERADTAFRDLQAGKEFGEVSKEYSVKNVAAVGGMIGSMPLSDFPENMRTAIEGLPDGSFTGVLSVDQGRHYIIKRISSATVDVPPYEAVREKIRSELTLKKRSDMVKAYITGYVEESGLSINHKLLEEL